MNLRDHPGFFGITSRGVIAIHADWPMYPEEHGADLALIWFTAFPEGTTFTPIDDIDRCNLFLADLKCSNQTDPFNARNFHVAVWHEDLLELRRRGSIEGVSSVSERRWEQIKRSDLPAGPLYMKLDDGTFKEVQLPSLDDYDEEDTSWPEFASGGIRVTPSGRSHAAFILGGASGDRAILGELIQQLIDLSFFDTAVREACVGLEHRIKTWLGSDRWGDSLVDAFISRLRDGGNYLESHLRVLRAQIRTTFKFIRNDFMHNFVDMSETQCRAVLFRVARVKAVVEWLTSSA